MKAKPTVAVSIMVRSRSTYDVYFWNGSTKYSPPPVTQCVRAWPPKRPPVVVTKNAPPAPRIGGEIPVNGVAGCLSQYAPASLAGSVTGWKPVM